jgi:hypothetical protein
MKICACGSSTGCLNPVQPDHFDAFVRARRANSISQEESYSAIHTKFARMRPTPRAGECVHESNGAEREQHARKASCEPIFTEEKR